MSQSFLNIRVAALAMAVALSGAAQANIVTNGDFETGSFSGWTQFGNTGATGVTGGYAHSGSFGGQFGAVGSAGGIFQTLVTVVGQTYDISFWLRADSGTPNTFAFNWDGGADELVFSNSPGFAYQQFTYALTATSATTDLRFAIRHDPAYYGVDDVVVTARVPEPMSLALVAVALVGAGAASRKKRAA